MNWKKILIIAGLAGMVANTAMAAQGDTSIIPQLKLGAGEADAGSIFGQSLGDEDINLYGVSADFLYGVNDNFEAGVGLGIDKIEFDDSDELDFTTFNLYGVGRYNFNTTNGYTPYVSGKLGYKWGDEDASFTGGGVTGKVEIEAGPFVGIAAGVEYNNFNFEIGYEHTAGELDASGTSGIISISDSTDVDYDIFYMAVGYRFNQ
ncbi:outer membrane beta-barrel protein [uncultured Ilyobacter sp.]|uniref:outer membrane beta-barrel protein n=1 Tax=uncultured Ilyobacter sp. TaxID=544433 RepID=UPI0029C7D934|nr:outer membrane beta-barrel protein [uncultured Ilyobacter sp.]